MTQHEFQENKGWDHNVIGIIDQNVGYFKHASFSKMKRFCDTCADIQIGLPGAVHHVLLCKFGDRSKFSVCCTAPNAQSYKVLLWEMTFSDSCVVVHSLQLNWASSHYCKNGNSGVVTCCFKGAECNVLEDLLTNNYVFNGV